MTDILTKLFDALPDLASVHAPTSQPYQLLKATARAEVEIRFSEGKEGKQEFGPFGEILFPFHRMGNITSLDLFGIDELILFAFYWANRNVYKKVADIGANIGLHSIVLDRCGYQVKAYEPDPITCERNRLNLNANGATQVELINTAVSDQPGELEFIRVLGNTTGSHLAGSKANPYGELERFPVKVDPIAPIMEWADFIKLDAEGHERQIFCATTVEQWQNTDAMIEVGTTENAAALYAHFSSIGLKMFAQKTNWAPVSDLQDLPTSHREGSLFLTMKNEVPWQ